MGDDVTVPNRRSNDWGTVHLVTIESGREFWYLWDLLHDHPRGERDQELFRPDREVFVEAFRTGHLYGLRVEETDAMYARRAFADKIFRVRGRGAFYLLPCVCITAVWDAKQALALWVDRSARRCGFGTQFVRDLHLARAYHPPPASRPFWSSCGIFASTSPPPAHSDAGTTSTD